MTPGKMPPPPVSRKGANVFRGRANPAATLLLKSEGISGYN